MGRGKEQAAYAERAGFSSRVTLASRAEILQARSRGGALPIGPIAPSFRTAVSGDYSGKRMLDIAVAGLALLLQAPVLVLISIAVIATSPGPALYWSTRIGRYGRKFAMPKFRTMEVSAPLAARENLTDELCITRVGSFLRRASLDELPQLYCVVTGEMSIVGPRPLLESDPASAARRLFPQSLCARPGLTGLAQVNGRNYLTPRRKARLDALYSRRVSRRLDAAIMVRSVIVVALGKDVM
jgi:O-antigen biosynthesis protein WbqP